MSFRTAGRRRRRNYERTDLRKELVSVFENPNDRPHLSGKDSVRRTPSNRVISVRVLEQYIRDKRMKSSLITTPKSSAQMPPSTENSELGGSSSVHVQRIATTARTNSIIRKQERKQSGIIHIPMRNINKSKKTKKIRTIVPLTSH